MRRRLALVSLFVVAGCKSVDEPAPAAAAPHAAAATPAPDQAALVARSEQLYRAMDDADADAVAAMLAPDFMRVTMARFFDGESLLKPVRVRKQRGWPRYSERRFDVVEVRFFDDIAIFTANTTAKLARAEAAEPSTQHRSVTLVWMHRQGNWLLVNWQEEMDGPAIAGARWDETYRASTSFELKPNKLLIETVHGREPGRALDIGVGQGRNALFLAAEGWKVTGVDISAEGIEQAQAAAKAAGLELRAEVADLNSWDWGEARWDLICFIYMGANPDVAKIRRALAPGGLVVIEYFAADGNAQKGLGGFEKGVLRQLFADGFEILRYDEVVDVADWGQQKVPLVRFVAQKQ